VPETIGPFTVGRVHQADCLDAMRKLPDGCVQCCVTSPPYWGLRKYDVPETVWGGRSDCAHDWIKGIVTDTRGLQVNTSDTLSGPQRADARGQSRGNICRVCGAWRGQLGLEPTPALYVEHLVGIFRELRRVLRGDGTLWLNIGDCWHSGDRGGYRNDSHRWEGSPIQPDSIGSHMESVAPNRLPQDGLKDRDLVGVPWRVAFALQADGWWLRDEVIWSKTSCMPYPATDRTVRSHEQVFLLSKSSRYFFDWKAIAAPAKHAGERITLGAKSLSRGQAEGAGVDPSGNGAADSMVVADLRRSRSVWTIGPEPNNAQHYAPFPRELARRCIVAGSRVGDVVLDPFAGTGTTVRVADGLQRKALGFDLGAGYVAQANERSGALSADDTRDGQQLGLLGRE